MSNADKLAAAEAMYGTGSKQHLKALKKWGTQADVDRTIAAVTNHLLSL